MKPDVRRIFFFVFMTLCVSFPLIGQNIDAVVSWQNKKLFFFSAAEYIKYDIKEQNTDRGYPRTINKVTWPGLWIDGVDAAVNWGNGKLYFFRGSEYIRYDEKKDASDPGYPKSISENWPGLWESGIDAALNMGKGKVYFFKGNNFIQYDVKTTKPDPGFPKPIASMWPGIWTEGIGGAVNRGNGKVYFFKGNSYIRYDIKTAQADPGYPRTIRSSNWPGIYFNHHLTLTQLNKSEVKPFLKPDYAFPVSRQYSKGCFAFAVNHILEYKYKQKIDMNEAEKRINKPREDLWTHEHIQNFNQAYNISLTWNNEVDGFFRLLAGGEPVMIQYKWYSSETSWIGHFVAVYSFDEYGAWVSDSISVKRIHIPYDDLFDESGAFTSFYYATIVRG
ncbi:MAG: hypothetical protein JXJ04_04395 [Spirochaetales bacterium]|nr:hypothetical protein [Spirochaetales bacterium]